jgi:hypothetical protein
MSSSLANILKDIIEPLVKRIRALEALERPYIAQGTATVLNGTTLIVVTHNLPYTPAAGDIAIWFCSTGNAATCYIDTYTAANFTIHTNADPGAATAVIGWKAIR